MAIREDHATSKIASTFYEVISRHGRFTQLRVKPKTGRTHQIRVHLAHVGSPILCDRLYAGHSEITEAGLLGLPAPFEKSVAQTAVLRRQALHARKLTFHHPQSGKPMTFEAPLPGDLADVVRLLESNPR
jgi:23S rRNA pseudouridine1911/1915/1917 synthase